MTRLSFEIKSKDLIKWQGQVVMSRSEEPYFERLFARLALDQKPERVLEIGFGLGISASLIQRLLCPDVHHIVEIDEGIYSDLQRFATEHQSVTATLGDWRCISTSGLYDFVFYDPFDFFEKTQKDCISEAAKLKSLISRSGVLCHPHFGDGEPRDIPGFKSVILEKYEVEPISMADGSECKHAATVLCYPLI